MLVVSNLLLSTANKCITMTDFFARSFYTLCVVLAKKSGQLNFCGGDRCIL